MPFKPLLLAALLGLSMPLLAAPEPAPAADAGDLSDIRQAISAAQADLQAKQAAQKAPSKPWRKPVPRWPKRSKP